MFKKKLRELGLAKKELHKHPFVVPVVTLLVLSFGTMVAFVALNGRTSLSSDSHVIQLSADGKKQVLPTSAPTVGEFIKRSKISLHDGDVVEPSPDTQIDSDDFRINVYRAQPVTIVDAGHKIQALSAATTPRSVAEQVGITVYPEDEIKQVTPDNILRDRVIGTQYIINRAIPVNLNLYGTQVLVRTHAQTVGDLIKEKNISLAGGDTVQPVATTPIASNIQVFVTRVGTQITTVEEQIPNETQYVEDATLSFGTTAVRQSGSPGRKISTYQLQLTNGKETSRTLIQEVKVQEPVPKIIARGKAIFIPEDKTGYMSQAGIAQSDYPYVNYIVSHESGWCPTKWQGQAGYCPPYYEQVHSESSGYGYGLGQATPANKMAGFGDDWRTSYVTQLKWASSYAGRYGGWEGAYNFWLSHHYW